MNDSRKELSFMKSYRVKGVRYRSVCMAYFHREWTFVNRNVVDAIMQQK